ncbi:MAG: ABC transporter ATP-binding protein [Rhodospirillaceae bacterium]|nr:ABC transporter ATP-binding protein [Rhodospirillaceae bacterium]
MTAPMLEIDNLTKRFGGLVALDHVTLDFEPDVLHAIIGPNGAGKTTLFNTISGMLKSDSGTVRFRGTDISGMAPHRISRLGMSRSLQIKSVFDSMTVAENLWIAAQARQGVMHPFASRSRFGRTAERVDEVLEQTGLSGLRSVPAGTLSYGDVALLEIGIALATGPSLLLLDEPICGMGPAETAATVEKIRHLAESVDIVVIEHDMPVVFDLADRITVMAQGGILARGAPDEIANNAAVREAYLGEEEDDEDDPDA